jgi:hypothetical protein
MPGKHWTQSEIESLTEQIQRGVLIEDVSIENKTGDAIRNQATRLGLIGDGIKRTPWTDDEKQILRTYVKDGWTAKSITEAYELGVLNILPGRSRVSIQKQMQRMGLGNKKRSRVLQSARRFSQEEKTKFRRFLMRNYYNRTPEELAKIWNKENPDCKIKRSRVVRHLEVLKIKLPWSEIIKMPYSKAKREKSAAKRRKARCD